MPVGPHPIGYVEVQRSVPPPNTPERALALDRALKSAREEAQRVAGRPMVYMGSRLEQHPDGSCVLYASFEPDLPPGVKPTPPLNPSNLNSAEQYVLGQRVDISGDARYHDDVALGAKEQKF